MKFVDPTLVTLVLGMFIGSMRTSGNLARRSAVRCSAVSSLVTAITARRPAAASSRAQTPGTSAGLLPALPTRVLTTTATPASAPASMTPWTIRDE